MTLALDLPGVRSFTDDLKSRSRQCDNGEGMICSNLDDTIDYYAKLCEESRRYFNQWARAIFTGELPLDRESERVLRAGLQDLLRRSQQVAAFGRRMDGECFELRGLNALHYRIADLAYLLDNWVTPQLAVSPAPRVKLPPEVEQQIRERIKLLPPLPHDWRPVDPAHLAAFKKRHGE